jgi:hypothetical protein
MPAPERRTPQEKLAEADQHIATAEELISRQQSVVAELERDGHDVETARDLLQAMTDSLAEMHRHRAIIEAELAEPDRAHSS